MVIATLLYLLAARRYPIHGLAERLPVGGDSLPHRSKSALPVADEVVQLVLELVLHLVARMRVHLGRFAPAD